jgi:hypothetical protein
MTVAVVLARKGGLKLRMDLKGGHPVRIVSRHAGA